VGRFSEWFETSRRASVKSPNQQSLVTWTVAVIP